MAITVESLLNEARNHLRDVDGEGRLDAEILLSHALARPRSFLRAWPEFVPAEAEAARFGALLERRRGGEPLAYIVGEREFWSLRLKVNRHTLIPRPETELLVEQALALIPADADWTIADLGAGSGAIALAIASERPGCRVIATDISRRALAAARANAADAGISNVEFRHGSWLAPLGDIVCDLIVSNPPYVARRDAQSSQSELAFEPQRALVAGETGLEALAKIAARAPHSLAPGGTLMLEHGFDQRAALEITLSQVGYEKIRCCRDLSSHDRVTVAIWPGQEARLER
ncbi:MAG TPA: peptide chain release factor N(5)-glutamine methyltransferase [Gammaproteobacteria bacterium]|nr:peptide chain release factor N(5)-glutamine methyltransferase [Gammaproteobacteria bacterium]